MRPAARDDTIRVGDLCDAVVSGMDGGYGLSVSAYLSLGIGKVMKVILVGAVGSVVVVLAVLVGLDGYRVYDVEYTYGRYVTTTFDTIRC